MAGTAENLAIARRYIQAIESGATGDELTQFFAPEVVPEIFPSKFPPHGSRDDLAGIRAGLPRYVEAGLQPGDFPFPLPGPSSPCFW